jgi:hypothetical protein
MPGQHPVEEDGGGIGCQGMPGLQAVPARGLPYASTGQQAGCPVWKFGTVPGGQHIDASVPHDPVCDMQEPPGPGVEPPGQQPSGTACAFRQKVPGSGAQSSCVFGEQLPGQTPLGQLVVGPQLPFGQLDGGQ